MARIATATAQRLEPDVESVLRVTRSGLAQLTGRETDRMIEPLERYAHLPALLRGIGALEQATAELQGIDRRLQALAQLKAATLTPCEYGIDLGSQISLQWGVTDEELLALPAYRTSPLLTDVETLVLDYAVGMSRTPVDVPDERFA
jgi:alkylhydroperoxidase family enzyme